MTDQQLLVLFENLKDSQRDDVLLFLAAITQENKELSA